MTDKPTETALQLARELNTASGGDYVVAELARLIDERTRLPQLAAVALAAQGVVDNAERRTPYSPNYMVDEYVMDTLRDTIAGIKTKPFVSTLPTFGDKAEKGPLHL